MSDMSPGQLPDRRAVVAARQQKWQVRLYRSAIFVLIVLVLAVLVWKVVVENGLRSDHEAQCDSLRSQHEQLLDGRTQDMLVSIGMLLETQAREMFRTNDTRALSAQLEALQRETAVSRVLVIDATGTVRAASESGLVGRPVEESVRPLLNTVQKSTVDHLDDGRLRLLRPLHDGARRIGLLLLVYGN